MEYAHRFSFTLHHRPLKPNEWVAHACDNKLCVNPAHLFTSDGNRENMQDATTKHILHHGERHYNAKLTDAQVTWVREQYTTGQQRIRDMAAQLGCTAHHLSDVIHYRRRKKETQHPTPGLQSALQTKLDD
jgi:hypothetical protein